MPSHDQQRPADGRRASRFHALGVLAAMLLCAALAAACGGGTASEGAPSTPADSSSPPSEASPAAGGTQEDVAAGEPDVVAFSQCMRENGIPDFPDPEPGGGFLFTGGVTQNPNFEAAQDACAHLQPTGSQAGQADPETLLQFAQCMRDNGVPDFSDPDLGQAGGPGGVRADAGGGQGGVNTDSPAYQAAFDVCGDEFGVQIMTPGN